jgi:hypothetical protein
MDFLKLRQSFINILEQIDTNPRIIIIDSYKNFEDLPKDYIDWTIDKVKRSYGINIPPLMNQLIFPDNIFLCWHYEINEQRQTGGEVNFKATISQYIDTTKTDFAHKLTEYSKKLYEAGYRFFDSHPNAGDGIQIALKIEKDTLAPNVWYVDVIHENKRSLELDYPSYVEHSINLKGLYEWQYLFMDVDFRGLDFDISPLRRRLEDYPKLFPGSDVNEYLKRYNDRHGY